MTRNLVWLFLLFSTFLPLRSASAQGNLMIVGGGLESDNKEIFEEILKLSGGAEQAVISVIPAASGVAAQTFAYFSMGLQRFGAKPENIHLIPVAIEDDDSTLDVNEATWLHNGNDEALADIVRQSHCVWFSGGDQLRIIKTLYLPDGSRTAVLDAVWDMFEKGGLVGGTSAGAAIMSDPMIGNGNSMDALIFGAKTSQPGEELPDHQGVLLTKGLGFFPHGLVDQHFHARSRTGRLIAAMAYTAQPMAFGIDENTALVYYGKEDKMKVAGTAGVTIFDAKNAVFSMMDTQTLVNDLTVHYLESGDTYSFTDHTVVPAPGKSDLRGKEKFDTAEPFPGGMFAAAPSFLRLATRHLMDNQYATTVSSLNFYTHNKAFLINLAKREQSKAFGRDSINGRRSYTLLNMNLSLKTVTVDLTPLHD